jgi:hypothetical protein
MVMPWNSYKQGNFLSDWTAKLSGDQHTDLHHAKLHSTGNKPLGSISSWNKLAVAKPTSVSLCDHVLWRYCISSHRQRMWIKFLSLGKPQVVPKQQPPIPAAAWIEVPFPKPLHSNCRPKTRSDNGRFWRRRQYSHNLASFILKS